MSGPDPDQTESSGSYSGGATTAKTAAGNTQRGNPGTTRKRYLYRSNTMMPLGVLPRLKEELTY